MLEFLPEQIKDSLSNIDFNKIYELRIRVNAPLYALIDGKYEKINYVNGYIFKTSEIEKTIMRLTEHSIYAYANSIKQGYLTGFHGERVGLSGECVREGQDIKIIKNVSSLCVRIPHQIINCSEKAYNAVFSNGLKSVIIISPPGMGKTTLIRDIARNISIKTNKNILVVDEKYEITGGKDGVFLLGETTDVLRGATKNYGFEIGVKNLKPDVIIVDELTTEAEINSAVKAVFSGVKVIATAHGDSFKRLSQTETYSKLFWSGAFDYAIVLSDSVIGEIKELVKLNDN